MMSVVQNESTDLTFTLDRRASASGSVAVVVINPANNGTLASQMVSTAGQTAVSLNFVPPGTEVELRVYNPGEYTLLDDLHLSYDRIVYHTVCDNSSDYRFGFNGQEKDNEKAGLGNTLEFGARIYDSRLGRWLSIDPVFKAWASPYQFGSCNPMNFVDRDGEDEIHFTFVTVYALNADGESILQTTLSVKVIENGSQEHTFHVHHYRPGTPVPTSVTLEPFHKGTIIAKQSSYNAANNSLPMAAPMTSMFFGSFPIDDYVYLGRLMQMYPQLIDYYSGDYQWKRALAGAQSTAGSYDFGQQVLTAEEWAYMLADGYLLLRGGVAFFTRAGVEIATGVLKVEQRTL